MGPGKYVTIDHKNLNPLKDENQKLTTSYYRQEEFEREEHIQETGEMVVTIDHRGI